MIGGSDGSRSFSMRTRFCRRCFSISASDSSIRSLMFVGSIFGAPVKAEHLAQDARNAVGLFGRDLQELRVRIVGGNLVGEQIQRVLDRLERIVDFVGDRGGQATGRGQLLRIEQDLLEAPPLQLAQTRHVLHDRHGGRDGAQLVAHLRRRDRHRQRLARIGVGQHQLATHALGRIEPQLRHE